MTRKKSSEKDIHPWDVDFKIEHNFDLNPVHKSFVALAMNKDTKMVFADGPAGTAKTYLATYCALNLLKRRRVEEVVYIRSVVESASQKLGSLPGEVEDKFLPWSMPMIEKLDELVGVARRKDLMERGYVHCVPVNFVRGLTFHDSVVIIDESQNLTRNELITILTRFGQNSIFIVVGDGNQSDISNRSGFRPICGCFDNEISEENGIYTFTFGEDEIVRSEVLRFIVSQLSNLPDN